ncbi:phenylacetic acid degradation protein [soil metagenome]
MDTQWPRWEVFKQDTPKKPHQAVGTVHATDAEHALLTARNVFARRPNAVSLWVVPASSVFSVTAEELADSSPQAQFPASEPQTYLVFCKTGHRRSMAFVDHIGEVEAANSRDALHKALTTFETENAVTWWLVPESAVTRSDDADIESWFAPAKTKTYKQQSAYGLVGTHPGEAKRSADEEKAHG